MALEHVLVKQLGALPVRKEDLDRLHVRAGGRAGAGAGGGAPDEWPDRGGAGGEPADGAAAALRQPGVGADVGGGGDVRHGAGVAQR